MGIFCYVIECHIPHVILSAQETRHINSYPICDMLYAAKCGKKMETMYLKTRYNCYAGRYAKSLDAVRRAETVIA